MTEEEEKQERIQAAIKFAKGLDELFKEFYSNHKFPYFISVTQDKKKPGYLVHGGLLRVILLHAANGWIPLQE